MMWITWLKQTESDQILFLNCKKEFKKNMKYLWKTTFTWQDKLPTAFLTGAGVPTVLLSCLVDRVGCFWTLLSLSSVVGDGWIGRNSVFPTRTKGWDNGSIDLTCDSTNLSPSSLHWLAWGRGEGGLLIINWDAGVFSASGIWALHWLSSRRGAASFLTKHDQRDFFLSHGCLQTEALLCLETDHPEQKAGGRLQCHAVRRALFKIGTLPRYSVLKA